MNTDKAKRVIRAAARRTKARRSERDDATGRLLVAEAFRTNRALLSLIEKLRGAHGRGLPVNMQAAAWRQIYDALWTGVAEMNRSAMQDPGPFSFGAACSYWPVIKSPAQGFEQEHPQAPEIFKRLKVGESTAVKIAGSKWLPDDVLGREALNLWHRVYNAALFTVPLDGDDSPEDRKADAQFKARCKALPGFMEDGSWLKWFALAREIFEREFNSHWSDPRERELWTSAVSPSKQGSPGRVKECVLRKIREKFASMAGANKG